MRPSPPLAERHEDRQARPSERPSDEELVARVQAGDTAAFDQLIERHKGRVYTLIYNMLSNREDAQDLSQEVFLKAFKSIGSFARKANFYTWLYRITINTALNFLRFRKEAHLSLDVMDLEKEDETILNELKSKESVHHEINCQELQQRLNETLQKLSEEHRVVVVLHDIEGMKHEEIGRVLGCSEATARTRLFYAHQQLQALLANYL